MGLLITMLVTDTAPLYPPMWGGPRRIWNIYSFFSKERFKVVYAGIKMGISGGLAYEYARRQNVIDEFNCSLPPYYRFWYALEQMIFPKTSLNLFLYLAAGSMAQFKSVIGSAGADVIVCSHPWSSPAAPKKGRQVFVYDAHNCEYLLMRQILRGHPLAAVICSWVKNIEAEACRKSDLILVCSEKERHDFIGIYGVDGSRIMVVPNGSSAQQPVAAAQKQAARQGLAVKDGRPLVLFIGAYYKPNNNAAQMIVDCLAPRMPGVSFIVAGSVKNHFRGERVPENVLLLGQLDERGLDQALLAADVAVNTVQEGSGVNIKMLDYMAYGLPVVTTACGCRGIDTLAGPSPYLVVEPSGFPQAIERLLADRTLAAAMSHAGRSLVGEKYSWEAISSQVETRILELVNKR